jgi:hypothetical protein
MKIKIDECPAGPAMDAAVAEVLGWENLHWEEVDRGPNHYAPEGWWGDGPNGECYLDKSYSTDNIAAAWELLSHFDEYIRICRTSNDIWYFDTVDLVIETQATSAPLAICRAFLKANGIEFVEVPE